MLFLKVLINLTVFNKNTDCFEFAYGNTWIDWLFLTYPEAFKYSLQGFFFFLSFIIFKLKYPFVSLTTELIPEGKDFDSCRTFQCM